MYGSLDVDCDTSDTNLFRGVAAKLPLDAVWITSTLKRTQQTAQALVKNGASADELIKDASIMEQDFGDLNGCTHEELFAQRDDGFLGFWPLPPEQQAPNGESFPMLRERVERFTERMTAEYAGRDVICVAHRGTILAALQIALDMPLRNSVSFDIGNVSMTQIIHHADVPADGPQWRVGEVGWLP